MRSVVPKGWQAGAATPPRRPASQSRPPAQPATGLASSPAMRAQHQTIQALFGGAVPRADTPAPARSRDAASIHIAPAQERHLPHEAWHVVQQAQGRVRPTIQLKDGVSVNDDESLEREADLMGAPALQAAPALPAQLAEMPIRSGVSQQVIQRAELARDKLNVAGELHGESGPRRADEAAYSARVTAGGYWREAQFKASPGSPLAADPFELRAKHLIAFANEAKLGAWLEQEPVTLAKQLFAGSLTIDDIAKILDIWRPDELIFYKDHVPADLFKAYENTLITDAPTFEKCFRNAREALSLFKRNASRETAKLLVDAADSIQLMFGTLDLHIKYLVHRFNIGSVSDISLERSERMHEAANAQSGTLGVWKVGEKHAEHMASFGGNNYELLSRIEFNAGYNLFIARRTALGKISAVANGDWGPYTTGLASRPAGVAAIRDLVNNAGAGSLIDVLRAVKQQATLDLARQSRHRHQKTTAFYAALDAMNPTSLASLNGLPALMDGIQL